MVRSVWNGSDRLIARVGLMLVLMLGLAGCELPYSAVVVPDPGYHPGWDCPPPEKMRHVTVLANPPCTWVPGGEFVESCRKAAIASYADQMGCTRESATTPAWYIMTPPVDSTFQFNQEAPLNQWRIFARYSTQAECAAALSGMRSTGASEAEALESNRPEARNTVVRTSGMGIAFARCIDKNDPRIKELTIP